MNIQQNITVGGTAVHIRQVLKAAAKDGGELFQIAVRNADVLLENLTPAAAADTGLKHPKYPEYDIWIETTHFPKGFHRDFIIIKIGAQSHT